MENENMALLHLQISNSLTEISQAFKPHMKLTFIARDPENSECELVVSNDNMLGVIETAQRTILRESAKGIPQ
jgi:hypothetical protein